MSYLASDSAFFCETFELQNKSFFDAELDAAVTERAITFGTMQGFCNVAAGPTSFAVTDANVRENVIADISGSTNRHRMITCALSMALFGHPLVSLPIAIDAINAKRRSVFLTETTTPLHVAVKALIHPAIFTASEYFGTEHLSGDFVGGVRHEDLERTSFPDSFFDVIITSDVMEHVPDAIAAEREIVRILKPGGAYCFTVPLAPMAEEDLVLAKLRASGELEYFSEPIYHGDPLRPEGVLVFRIFSVRQMTERFAALGTLCTTYRLWSKAYGIIGPGCYVHIVKKT